MSKAAACGPEIDAVLGLHGDLCRGRLPLLAALLNLDGEQHAAAIDRRLLVRPGLPRHAELLDHRRRRAAADEGDRAGQGLVHRPTLPLVHVDPLLAPALGHGADNQDTDTVTATSRQGAPPLGAKAAHTEWAQRRRVKKAQRAEMYAARRSAARD